MESEPSIQFVVSVANCFDVFHFGYLEEMD